MSTTSKVILGIIAIVFVCAIAYGARYYQQHHRVTPQKITLTSDGRDATIESPQETGQITETAGRSPLSGVVCEHWQRRPVAIMYSGDPNARPLFTNISQADIVVEMPHRATHGGTRVMGIFQCATPKAVGPMRSGRTDFINFATAFDAIFVPWGGSGIALGLLQQHLVDFIDCNGQVAPGGNTQSCFRRMDHGFNAHNNMLRASSSVEALLAQSKENGYRMTTNYAGLSHQTDIPLAKRPEYGKLKIRFEGSYRVTYEYDRQKNAYKRFFGKHPSIDYENNAPIYAKNIVVIPAKKEAFVTSVDYQAQGLLNPWYGVEGNTKELASENGAYPNFQLGDPWFDTVHEGVAYFYMNGQEITGRWHRAKGVENPFEFTDDAGNPIHFVEGQTWIEVPELNRKVTYYTQPQED